jgi:hypothetical protein
MPLSMSKSIVLACVVSLGVAGCPSGETPPPKEDFGNPGKGDDPIAIGTAAPEDLSSAPPDVSRSVGHKGGVVVLWPHLVPPSDDPAAKAIAAKVQQHLADLAHRAAGARDVDVRPAPETRCGPKVGCEATSVSAVIVMKGTTCAVAALIAGPKKAPAHLLPWSGKADFTKDIVPFGEPADPLVKVKDFVPCDALLDKKQNEEAAIARYITGLLPGA